MPRWHGQPAHRAACRFFPIRQRCSRRPIVALIHYYQPSVRLIEPMQKKHLRAVFLLLAFLGLAVPWYFNVVYFLAGGSVMPDVFWRDAFANPLTTGITLDVYLAAVAFSVWIAADRSLGAWRWACIAACFGISLAFAMPVYLAYRLRADANERDS